MIYSLVLLAALPLWRAPVAIRDANAGLTTFVSVNNLSADAVRVTVKWQGQMRIVGPTDIMALAGNDEDVVVLAPNFGARFEMPPPFTQAFVDVTCQVEGESLSAARSDCELAIDGHIVGPGVLAPIRFTEKR